MAPKATFDADFGKFVSELTKVDVKLREFEPAADRASAKLQRMADSLNGNKLLEQAGVAVGAISRIEGGVAALNNGELRRYGTLIDAATEKLVRQGREVPPALAQVKAAIDQARQPLDAMKTSATAAGGAMTGIAGAIGQGLGIGAGIGVLGLATQAVSGLKDGIVEIIEEGNKLSQLRTAFERLQGGPGPAALAMADLRTATRGLVADVDLLAAANKASLLGLGQMGIKTDELASIAVRLGKAMGQDAAKSVDDLTTALARQSPQILDNLGIKVDLTTATATYATALGKSAEALTDEERKMAFATAAMDAAREKAATLGEAQLTLSEQIGRVGSALDNMQAGLGASANESGILAGLVGTVADRLVDLEANAGAAADQFADASKFAEPFYGGLREMPELSKGFADGIGLVILPALGYLNVALQAAAAGLKDLRTARDVLNGSIDDVSFGAKRTADIQLGGGTFGQGQRALDVLAGDQKRLTDEYTKAQDEALRKIEQGEEKAARRIDQLAEQRRQRLQRLTGRDQLVDAQQLMGDVFGKGGVGLASLSDKTALSMFDKLVDAKAIAARLQPQLVAGLETALTQLSANAGVLRRVTQDAGKKLVEGIFDRTALRAGVITGVNTLEREISQQLIEMTRRSPAARQSTLNAGEGLIRSALDPASLTTDARSFGGLIGEGNLDAIYGKLDRTVRRTADWNTSLRGVSQAFANLSQVSGGLSPITRQVGLFVTSLDTAEQLVTSVGTALNKDFNFGKSKTGQIAATGLAAGLQGWDIGTSSGLSPWRAAAVGGLTGAASGAPALALGAATGGASIAVGAIVGATTAYFGAQKAAKELRKAKDLQAETLVAQYGTLDALLDTAGRLGLNQQTFLERFYGEPKEFAKGVTDLNNALTREKNTADELGKSLEKVQKAQGVLSRGDRAALTDPRAGGPTEGLAKEFKSQQTDSLLGGLDRILQAPGPLSASLVKSVGQSFPAALTALEQQGASPIEALKTLMPLLDQFREKAVLAGAGSTPGFDALNNQLALLKDKQLGPLIERASGAGQALGALSNLNLLDDETFSGFAASITESVAGMDLLSDKGQNAMRLIRGPLQNVWQLQQDFGFAVDESTQKLLDQANSAGLIGDRFRPTEEKLLLGIDRVVDRLDTLIDKFSTDLVDDATTGAGLAGRNILDAFDRVRPRIRVAYEYDTPDTGAPPAGPVDPSRGPGTGSTAAQRATASSQGGDIYLDGERVGYHSLRHAGAFADLIGA